ncbi:MAG: alpha-2-macroglobulin family protein, partial [Xanthomonadales bacterium]|nr:alpha-2-macroglobulin family protein [Xanthomonadales bacterium]
MLIATLRWLLRLPGRLLAPLLGQLSWQPAPWQRWYGHGLRQRPWHYAGLPLLLVALVAAGWWWSQRPRPIDPEALTMHLEAPGLTRYLEEGPQVEPLILQFSGSAAPLAAVDGPASGVSLQPPLEGRWQWEGDDRLRFDPADDWPVGELLEVRLEKPIALGPKVRLVEEALVFKTAPFVATLSSAEFYQDPTDPSLKRGAYAVRFSHPVDVLDFERALSLQLRDGAARELPAPQVEVRYDERKLTAWVQSSPLQVPENGGQLQLQISASYGAQRGGPEQSEVLSGTVGLPSLYSVALYEMRTLIVDNERFEPEQVLWLRFNDRLRDRDVAEGLRVWLLPSINPEDKRKQNPYRWSQSEVSDAVLASSERLTLTALPSEDAFSEQHSFRFRADPGRRLYVEIDRGLRAFGGFLLGERQRQVQSVPDYPSLLRFVGDGAVLSLRGERRISVAARNVPGLALEVARIKPDQLQHLVQYNQGNFDGPSLYQPSVDSLSERFEHRVELSQADPARTDYQGIDLGEYFRPDRHGVFLLRLFEHDPADPVEADQRYPGEDYSGGQRWDGAKDARLVLLTDLGIVAKTQLDRTRQVFVMSLSQGTPVVGATVRAVGRNGESLHVVRTGSDGRADLPDLSEYRRERQAVMLTVSAGEDLSFLPLEDSGRRLQLSRFDIGGEVNTLDPGKLKAWLFSDRGLYRPGDELHVGMIVRASDWSRSLTGLPLEFELTDPRGTRVLRQRLSLDASGFMEQNYQPAWTAPTGTWEARLLLVAEDDRRELLGTTTLQVRD